MRYIPRMRSLPLLLVLAACADKATPGDGPPLADSSPPAGGDSERGADSEGADSDPPPDSPAGGDSPRDSVRDTGERHDTEAPPPSLSSWTATATSDEGGLVDLEIEVDGHRSFLIHAVSDDVPISLEALYAPGGERVLHWSEWVDANSLTWAFYPVQYGMSFNWPVRAEDGPLTDGTWRAAVATYTDAEGYIPDVEVHMTVHTARDADVAEGTFSALLIWADGLDDDPAIVAAVEAAVERWREVWAPIGLSVEVRYLSDVGLTHDLPSPADPRADLSTFLEMSALAEEGEITMMIGETIGGNTYYYGMAGNIPSALVPSEYSGVALAWLAAAGRDAEFDENEILGLGETMAHEVGHYAGLFHPVDSSYRYWDALDDTVECSTRQSCEEKLGENLMFPYAICDWTDCLSVWQITDDQSGVFHHYTGNLVGSPGD